eukprot:m.746319 g.746319  ORF g.746319 m.746319 type:complete len:190 (+) comp58958_c0_seq42:1936-2505(+)
MQLPWLFFINRSCDAEIFISNAAGMLPRSLAVCPGQLICFKWLRQQEAHNVVELDGDGKLKSGGAQSGALSTNLTHFFVTLDRCGEYFFTSEGFELRRICSILVTETPLRIPEPTFHLLPQGGLNLSLPVEDVTLVYTLDGSRPSLNPGSKCSIQHTEGPIALQGFQAFLRVLSVPSFPCRFLSRCLRS